MEINQNRAQQRKDKRQDENTGEYLRAKDIAKRVPRDDQKTTSDHREFRASKTFCWLCVLPRDCSRRPTDPLSKSKSLHSILRRRAKDAKTKRCSLVRCHEFRESF